MYQLWTVNSQHMEINKGRVPAVDSQQSTHGNQQRARTSCGQSTVNTWKSTKGRVPAVDSQQSTHGNQQRDVYQLWTVNSQHMEINKGTCTSCGQSTVNTWKSTKGRVPAVDSQQSTHGNQQRDVYQLWTVNSQHMEINKGRVPAVDSQQSTHGNQQRACTSCGQSTVNTWKSTISKGRVPAVESQQSTNRNQQLAKDVYQPWTVNKWRSTKVVYQLWTQSTNRNQLSTCT